MAGYEQSITWTLLRPHLLQAGCPTSDPTRIGPKGLYWDLDPATQRVAIGWETPGLVRIGRGFAMKGDLETRWVAYELDATTVLLIEVWYSASLWVMAAISTDLIGYRVTVNNWLSTCSGFAMGGSVYEDAPKALGLGSFLAAIQERPSCKARPSTHGPVIKNQVGYRRTGREGTPKAAKVVRQSTFSLAKSGTSRDN